MNINDIDKLLITRQSILEFQASDLELIYDNED